MMNFKKRLLSVSLAVMTALSGFSINVLAEEKTASVHVNEAYETSVSDAGISMYRLYNPNSGEHFYTSNSAEKDRLVRAGWGYEGIGWVAPSKGQPVYRLYNSHSGDHHYTASVNERNGLKRIGWRDEGIGWYSGGNIPLYRQYNRHAKSGSHNYTTSKSENDVLVKAGWKAEGIGWYGIAKGKAADASINYYSAYAPILTETRSRLSGSGFDENLSGYYTLYDIDGNGVKDLFVDFHPYEAGATLYVYTIRNGKAVQWKEIGFGHSGIDGSAGRAIVYEGGNMGYTYIARLRWDGSQLVSENLGENYDPNGVMSPGAYDSWRNNILKRAGCKDGNLKIHKITDYSFLR